MSCIPSTSVCAESSDRRHSLDMHLPCKHSEYFQDGRPISHFNDTSVEEKWINFLMNSSQRQSENPVSVKPEPKRRSRHNKRRRKSASESRNLSRGKYRHPGIPFKACTTVADWVHLTKSEDIWGDTVNISSHITVGGTTVGQYFYESFCEHEGSPCTGIKTEEYNSSCTTIHIWTYAHVFKNGEEGWNFIKIKGGCNCHLQRIIPPSSIFSIFDLN
ncbi:hypothetical protein CHS0354_039574 [Potamilus streckersoni]|uniref:Nerve growth factor-related domain-containing protein n=1 Tax=Potamilus streckersoni TaxID=2493646 RepID=A0AAE0W1D8_9BIVA|nr:hypothetical protein CHS0354_039574 [Potamilus streckersoni]